MTAKDSKTIEWLRDFGVALQHLFLVLPVTLSVPELFGSSIGLNNSEMLRLTQMTLMAAGFACMIFALSKSSKRPLHLIIGADMALLAIGIRAASHMTLSAYFGLLIIGGLISILLSYSTRYWLKWLTPPVLIASMVLYGVSFIPVAMDWLMGGVGSPDYGSHRNLLVGIAVIIFTLFLDQYGKGFIKYGSVGLGFVLGFAMSVPMGLVKWTRNIDVEVLQLPRVFTVWPSFELSTFGWLFPIILLLVLKQVMDLQFIAKQQGLEGEERQALTQVGMRRYSLATFVAAIFGSVGLSASAPNLGFFGMGHQHARKPYLMVSVMLLFLGLSPLVTSILGLVPLPVVGALAIMLIAALMHQTLMLVGTRHWKSKDVQIVGFSVVFGLMAMLKPETVDLFGQSGRIIMESGLGVTFLTALMLQLIIPEY